jgi:hypothetical protein
MMKTSLTVFLLILILQSPASGAGGEGDFSSGGRERNYITYSINRNSWTSLSGTTNINSFECLSDTGIPNGIILTDSAPDGERIYFSEAKLSMDAASFDCGNPLITRDMHKSLGGPGDAWIDIKLLEAQLMDGSLSSENGNFTANALITINGRSNIAEIMIDWARSGSMEYRFEGSTDLKMSDFGITPPSPALGLVKVKDDITVRFNYIVQPFIISRLD